MKRIITVRVEDKVYRELQKIPNYSEYIRDAIDKKMASRIFMCDICGAESDTGRGWEITPKDEICPNH